MSLVRRNPAALVWLVLMLVTGVSWTLGTDHDVLGLGSSATTVVVMAVAFLKVHLIGGYFMELRHAPRPLRLLFAAWVVLVGGVVIVAYLTS